MAQLLKVLKTVREQGFAVAQPQEKDFTTVALPLGNEQTYAAIALSGKITSKQIPAVVKQLQTVRAMIQSNRGEG